MLAAFSAAYDLIQAELVKHHGIITAEVIAPIQMSFRFERDFPRDTVCGGNQNGKVRQEANVIDPAGATQKQSQKTIVNVDGGRVEGIDRKELMKPAHLPWVKMMQQLCVLHGVQNMSGFVR